MEVIINILIIFMTSLPRIHSVDNSMLLIMENPFSFEFHQSTFKYTVTSCEIGVLLLFQSELSTALAFQLSILN